MTPKEIAGEVMFCLRKGWYFEALKKDKNWWVEFINEIMERGYNENP